MARSMRLFLIRHGETVDNVAQLYGGSRDSALTNHGYQQAKRLGSHFEALGMTYTHFFSSHLQRAAKTAGLIREAQLSPKSDVDNAATVPDVQQLRILMEQNFGDLEGMKWTEMQAELQKKPGFVAVETKEAMSQRADAFLDRHLWPLLDESSGGPDPIIAIVSHGIFLSTLWKRLLRCLPARSIALSPDLQLTLSPSLEHLGGWSNTGYLELHMTRDEEQKSPSITDATLATLPETDTLLPVESKRDHTLGAVEASEYVLQNAIDGAEVTATSIEYTVEICGMRTINSTSPTSMLSRTSEPRITRGWTTTILTINGKDHLKGLKRTGGGVGSSRHDASQMGIESFFKRQKVD